MLVNLEDQKSLFVTFFLSISACSKTNYVKDLLYHNTTRIQPEIQRIVWLYKRWQPLYNIIHRSVSPRVEFIQGIPSNLEDDDYFDPRINNLLILDDLFSEAGKDKRITDLFTEGSHHRSLSVISISQNLFASKDPTQRRNCHYLVLFNNPIDRQSVMTLARQMYPGQSEKMMKMFEKATKKPYGYLLVDLKPFTPENDRLKSEVLWADQHLATGRPAYNQSDHSIEPIKEGSHPEASHSDFGFEPVHIEEQQQEIMAEKGQACDDCGLLFDTFHDVQRHVKRGWCPETTQSKKRKIEEDTDEDDGPVEDNEAYNHLWKLAKKEVKDRFDRLYDRYLSDGENENDAADMARDRVKQAEENDFFQRYTTLLEVYWFPLKDSSVHKNIVQQINLLREKGVSLSSAVKRVINKNKGRFEDLFDTEISEDEASENNSDDETDNEQI